MMRTAYSTVPRAAGFDDSVALMREGYTYISSRCDTLDTDVFQTRLMLKRAFCARGASAAEVFYGTDLFTRTGAMPKSAQHLLQDEGSVQDLDDDAHRVRKELFLPMLAPESVQTFIAELTRAWTGRASRWPQRRVVLYDEVNHILTTAALRWVGLSTNPDSVSARCRELTAMVDNAGSAGPRNWFARALRRRSERWAVQTVMEIRNNARAVDPDQMSSRIAYATEDDDLLSPQIAAVELLNILRPIVAISRFIVFAALALWQFPQWQQRFQQGDEARLDDFVEEIRRYYPFFPAVGGRARRTFQWEGHVFPADSWFILDLYGTNHDPRLWEFPDAFRPERFDSTVPGAYRLIAQGGGQHATSHRCPGERITTASIAQAIRLLSSDDYEVPAQDLTLTLSRMPAVPRSGFLMKR